MKWGDREKWREKFFYRERFFSNKVVIIYFFFHIMGDWFNLMKFIFIFDLI